jgi:hypothetical protein
LYHPIPSHIYKQQLRLCPPISAFQCVPPRLQDRIALLQKESKERLAEWQGKQQAREAAKHKLQAAVQQADVEVAVSTQMVGQWPPQIAERSTVQASTSAVGEVRARSGPIIVVLS